MRHHRLLPDGGELDPLGGTDLAERLGADLAAARRTGRLSMDTAARAEWHDIYAQLSEPTDGLVGLLTARADAHVLRLAMLDALVDGEAIIRPAYLRAAVAIWDYAARSVTWATRHTSADPVAEQIHTALAAADGLTRTQLRDLFAHNLPAARLDAALTTLGAAGRARRQRLATAGRLQRSGSPPPTPESRHRLAPSPAFPSRPCAWRRSDAPASLR